MKRTTISFTDELLDALDRYRDEQGLQKSLALLVRSAVEEYLARRGYEPEPVFKPFQITPAVRGSGSGDASADHDRLIAESIACE